MRRIVLWVLGVLVFVGLATFIAGEVVETVVVHSYDADGTVHNSKVWVADIDGTPWVRVGRAGRSWGERLRANPHAELVRAGVTTARVATLDDSPETRAQRRRGVRREVRRRRLVVRRRDPEEPDPGSTRPGAAGLSALRPRGMRASRPRSQPASSMLRVACRQPAGSAGGSPASLARLAVRPALEQQRADAAAGADGAHQHALHAQVGRHRRRERAARAERVTEARLRRQDPHVANAGRRERGALDRRRAACRARSPARGRDAPDRAAPGAVRPPRRRRSARDSSASARIPRRARARGRAAGRRAPSRGRRSRVPRWRRPRTATRPAVASTNGRACSADLSKPMSRRASASGTSWASAPPARTTSARPARIRSAAYPSAPAPAAIPMCRVVFGPWMPSAIVTSPAAALDTV